MNHRLFGIGTRVSFTFLFMLGRPVQAMRRCCGLLMLPLACLLTLWGGARTSPTSAAASLSLLPGQVLF